MKKHKKLKIAIIFILLILFAAYWTVIYFLVDAVLVPSFMEQLQDFQRISEKGYSELVYTDDITENQAAETAIMREWFQETQKEKLTRINDDGYRLVAVKFTHEKPVGKWVLLLHGYTGIKEMMYIYAMHYYEWGYDVLVPDLRCQGESEGDYIGMGLTDAYDCIGWLDVILTEDPRADIVIHGQSMGAACALIMSGMPELPQQVSHIVSDASYTDAYTMFGEKAGEWFSLPAFPFVDSVRLMLLVRGGYDLYDASALDAVKKSRIPTLFIHGDADRMISVDQAYELYDAASCEKKLLIVEGAGHGQANYKDPENVYGVIYDWIG